MADDNFHHQGKYKQEYQWNCQLDKALLCLFHHNLLYKLIENAQNLIHHLIETMVITYSYYYTIPQGTYKKGYAC